ncbi:MAG: hypothetical protein F9K48_00235 [Candidatus Brocadia sp.]|nr:MAG: hypothetical protein F9K48_00235 [Candidatus Brocadia sp.]
MNIVPGQHGIGIGPLFFAQIFLLCIQDVFKKTRALILPHARMLLEAVLPGIPFKKDTQVKLLSTIRKETMFLVVHIEKQK